MQRGGGTIAAAIFLVITGVIIADILIHPAGTQAAGQAISGVSGTAFNALLGGGR